MEFVESFARERSGEVVVQRWQAEVAVVREGSRACEWRIKRCCYMRDQGKAALSMPRVRIVAGGSAGSGQEAHVGYGVPQQTADEIKTKQRKRRATDEQQTIGGLAK